MKYLVSCLVVVLFCLGVPLKGQNVGISIDHPNQVNAGEEFTVSVTITKGSLTDYSRFSQDLPLGLSAVNVSSPNADFSFDNQRIANTDMSRVSLNYGLITSKSDYDFAETLSNPTTPPCK